MRTTIVTCLNCGTKNRVPVAEGGVPRCGKCNEALPWIVDAEATDFDAIVDSALPVLVDMWAAWCGPCRMVSPAVESLGRSFAGRVKVVKLDIDAAPDIAARFGVQSIPTLLLLRNGEEIDRFVGAGPEPMLREWLDRKLAETGAAAPS